MRLEFFACETEKNSVNNNRNTERIVSICRYETFMGNKNEKNNSGTFFAATQIYSNVTRFFNSGKRSRTVTENSKILFIQIKRITIRVVWAKNQAKHQHRRMPWRWFLKNSWIGWLAKKRKSFHWKIDWSIGLPRVTQSINDRENMNENNSIGEHHHHYKHWTLIT